MDINTRISYYFQDYKTYMDAGRTAEQRGNFEAAKNLYKQAALALCKMAELESGETKIQRVRHAEQIMQKAESVGVQPTAANNAPKASSAGSSAANRGTQMNSAKDTPDDEENPWRAEEDNGTTFDDVIGMEDVKKLLRTRVLDQIKYPELYASYGLSGGTGVLLFGLPGTGKTTIARAIAHEINAPLYLVSLSSVLNKWVGESERMIRLLFEKARTTPTSLIFFDDFDALGMERKDDNNHGNKIIVELLTQMDGFRKNTNKIVLLAATNRPWVIDPALMRPGRFEHHFYVPLPNHEARISMIGKILEDKPLDPAIDMHQVSDLMNGYNGADIVSVVNSAKAAALQRTIAMREIGDDGFSRITFDDFANAAAQHKSSVVPDDIVRMRKYADERGIEMPDEM